MGCIWQGVDTMDVLLLPAQSPRTSARLAKPPRASGYACKQVTSPENDDHSLPYLVTSHVLAPGDRKLFSTDVSIESHVLGEGIKRVTFSPLGPSVRFCYAHAWGKQGARQSQGLRWVW